MKFKTESGSEYEIDCDLKRVRRITNVNARPATERQGDNTWREYLYCIPDLPLEGKPLFVCWDIVENDPTCDGQTRNKGTLTSRIVTVFAEGDEN